MRKLIHVAVVAALGLPLTTLAAEQTDKQRAQPAQQQQMGGQSRDMTQSAQFMRGSKLIGMDIKNAQGKDLGEIQDLVVDINNNRVHYAMVDAQNKMFAYPVRVLQFPAGKDHALLNVAEDRLERAPGIEKNRWKEGRFDPAYGRDVDTYWDRDQRVVDQDKKTAAEGDRVPGKAVKVEPRANMELAYASKLIGWNIETPDNNDIGEIKDLVVNVTNGKVHFAVVDFNKTWKALDDRLHPVPLSAFKFQDGRDDLVLNVAQNKFKADRGFTEGQLDTALKDPNFVVDVDRYMVVLVPIEPAGAAGQPGAAGHTGGEQKSSTPGTTKQDMQQRGQEKSKNY